MMRIALQIATRVRPVAWLLLACLPFVSVLAGGENLKDVGALNEQAPDEYTVRFDTTKGEFVLAVHRDWAPLGADRFYNLVKNGFYNDVRFFRVVPNFVVQFGLSGDPSVNSVWREARIKDDPVKESNKRGTISFATGGPDTRTTQVFINLGNNARLDGMGFSPFGEVVSGMDVVSNLFGGYGDGVNKKMITTPGNSWFDDNYPELDKLTKATIGPPHGAK